MESHHHQHGVVNDPNKDDKRRIVNLAGIFTLNHCYLLLKTAEKNKNLVQIAMSHIVEGYEIW